MKIVNIRAIHGPNVYHSMPVMVMGLDLEDWADLSSKDIPGFNDRISETLPGLVEHTCSPGCRGGFLQRLERGTYLAHISEHVALELATLAGIEVSFGKSRYAGRHGLYNVIVRFKNEEGMRLCLKYAVELVTALVKKESFELQPAVDHIKSMVRRTALGPSTNAIFEAAKRRGVPARRMGEDSLIQLGYGKHVRRIQSAVTDRTSLIAKDLVQDKERTKDLLHSYSIPVPRGETVSTIEGLDSALRRLRGPYVVKPLDGHHGNGVALNLENREDAIKAFELAKKYGRYILVEEMIQGKDYRVLVVGGKLVAAAERRPPMVIGDGQSSINQLIDVQNQDPRRGDGHEAVLTKIKIDDITLETLTKAGFTPESIPAAGEEVLLRGAANLSSGGTAKDVTDEVHPEVRFMCERIARLVGLDICGIDIIHKDIQLKPSEGLNVIEVNAGPGLRMHLAPTEGKARDVGASIVEMMYPQGAPTRIPIAAVTGTNGKTTVVRLLNKIFAQNHCVGMTSTEGIWIDGVQVASGDTSGPQSAMTVLSDPAVEVAILEVARGGLLRRGLAFQDSDVGVITNVRPDHIGQDGIETLEDLIWIKSLVADSVREGGVLVLNADDPASLSIKDIPRIKRVPREVTLYSINARHPAILEHVASGGAAMWVEDGYFHFAKNGSLTKLHGAAEIPLTMNGTATFQVSNVMAAMAAAFGLGANVHEVIEGVKSFNPINENLGRMNVYKVHDVHVIIDYGHNPDAIAAVGQMVAHWPAVKKTAIFGLPGDRADYLLKSSADMVAKYFDRLLIYDEKNLRNRDPMVVPNMLCQHVHDTYPEKDCSVRKNEELALREVLASAKAGDIITVFSDRRADLLNFLREFDPVPVVEIPMQQVYEEVGTLLVPVGDPDERVHA